MELKIKARYNRPDTTDADNQRYLKTFQIAKTLEYMEEWLMSADDEYLQFSIRALKIPLSEERALELATSIGWIQVASQSGTGGGVWTQIDYQFTTDGFSVVVTPHVEKAAALGWEPTSE